MTHRVARTSLVASVALASLSAFATGAAHAQVRVDDAWVRPTVPEQKATGAYMSLTAARAATLVAASSPVAAAVEVHEMRMDGDVMRMRTLAALPLPAGTRVVLGPGAYHLMLLGLRHPVTAGEVVPITLVVQTEGGGRETVEVRASVRATVPAPVPAPVRKAP